MQLSIIISGNGVSPEHVARRGDGELVLTHEHFARKPFFEEHRLFFAMGTHDNFDVGIDRACDPRHAARFGAVRRGDHQHARFVDVRLNEDARFRGIAEHCRHVLSRKPSTISRLSSTTTVDIIGDQRFTSAPANSPIAQ